jgi:hypothetical protein
MRRASPLDELRLHFAVGSLLRLPAWRLSDKAGLLGLSSLASDLPAGSRPAAPGVQRLHIRYGGAMEAAPAAVDALPAGAFFFLELLHFAASNVDVAQPDRLRMTCTSCGGAFLPVFARR